MRVFVILSLMSAVAAATAMTITVKKQVGNAFIRAVLTIDRSNVKGNYISGTKIEVIPGIGAGPTGTGPDPYHNALCYRAKIKVGGQQMYDNTYFDPAAGGGGNALLPTHLKAILEDEPGPVPDDALEPVWPSPQISSLPEYAQVIPGPEVVRFSSTHFSHGSTVPVELTLWYAFYRYGVYVGSDTVVATLNPVAYNKASIYGRNEWEAGGGASSGTGPAQSYLNVMSHNTADRVTFAGWDRANILPSIETCTAFYVNTHGNWWQGLHPSPANVVEAEEPYAYDSHGPRFWTDVDKLVFATVAASNRLPATGYTERGQPQVYDRRLAASATLPRINLAWLDVCVTGLDNEFAAAFLYPIDYDQNGNTINQAEVGWRIFTNLTATNADGNAFWGALALTKTAHEARDALVTQYLSQIYRPNPFPLTHYVSVYGDYYTRLNGVWTGNDSLPSTVWYQVFP